MTLPVTAPAETGAGILPKTRVFWLPAFVITPAKGSSEVRHGCCCIGDHGWRRRVASLRSAAPFVVHRLWLDRKANPDRAAFLGTGGRPPLDILKRSLSAMVSTSPWPGT